VYPILAAGGIAVAKLLGMGIRWIVSQITADVVETLDGRLGLEDLRSAVTTVQRELRPNTGESMKDQSTAGAAGAAYAAHAAIELPPVAPINGSSSISDLIWSLSTRINHLDEAIVKITTHLGLD